MKFLLCFLLSVNSFAAITSIYKTNDQSYLGYQQFLNELPENGFVVLGEFHNTESIQNAQAKIIKDKTILANKISTTKIMWEFLDYTNQKSINASFNSFLSGEMNAKDFTSLIAGEQNLAYAPIMEVAKEFKQAPIALNLPRELKKKAMDSGIDSLDPQYVPAHHYLGGDVYLARFQLGMGGHAPDDMVTKYFLAQCLTDSVMSEQASLNHQELSFIVAGSFHTDFYDGTVSRIKIISSEEVVTIKITSKEMYDEEYILGHDIFGTYADYILITE